MAKTTEINQAASVSSAPMNNGESSGDNRKRYVVVRDGYRVSDREYDIETDPSCVSEIDFWTKVSENHSCGEKVEVVVYDSKRHRVW